MICNVVKFSFEEIENNTSKFDINLDRIMIDIVIASDDNYLHLVSVCIVSLFETNRNEPFHIHLLSNGIETRKLKPLESIMDEYGGQLSVYHIENLRDMLAVEVPHTISITSYARLFAGSILPAEVDKVLYIDCDIMFNSSITGLRGIDLGDCLVGGILDPLISRTYKKEIRIPKDEPYINAGVLLIPLNRWRSEGMEQKFINYLIERKGKVHHHDQGIINAVCASRKKILPPQFNVMSNSICYPWRDLRKINTPFYSRDEYEAAIVAPAIIHFTGAILGRPWVEECTHPYAKKFMQYKAMTTYENIPLKPNNQSILHRLEGALYRRLPFWLFKLYMQSIYHLSYLKHSFRI